MKRKLSFGLTLVGMLVLLLSIVSCPNGLEGDAELEVRVLVEDTARILESRIGPLPDIDVNITPSSYKIAVAYFALIMDDTTPSDSDDNTRVVLVDTTGTSPEVLDFSGSVGVSGLLLGKKLMPKGDYIGYEMAFDYLEMDLDVDFHEAPVCSDSADGFFADGLQTRTFRQYYNATGPFYKRDMVVFKPNSEPTPVNSWFWMRREVDSSQTDFFIDSATTSHPSGGAGPDNVIDLFSNEDFWGDEADYDDPTVVTMVSSVAGTTGIDATMEPFTLSFGETLLLTVNVHNKMNFKEEDGSPGPYENGNLDLGPMYNSTDFGDRGLHPMMPDFNLKPIS
jgi:hypothetical protein